MTAVTRANRKTKKQPKTSKKPVVMTVPSSASVGRKDLDKPLTNREVLHMEAALQALGKVKDFGLRWALARNRKILADAAGPIRAAIEASTEYQQYMQKVQTIEARANVAARSGKMEVMATCAEEEAALSADSKKVIADFDKDEDRRKEFLRRVSEVDSLYKVALDAIPDTFDADQVFGMLAMIEITEGGADA